MKRSEVKLEDKWKLEDLYESDEKWEADFKSLSARTEETLAYRGKLSDKKQLLACLKLIDELMLKAEWLYGYAHMRKDENVSLGKYVGMSDRAMSLYVALSSAQSFVEPELSALDESVLKKFIADPDFADYSYMLKQVLRVKAHILGEESEKLLAMVSESLGCFRNTFAAIDNVDLPLPKVKDSKGDEIQLTHGTYGALLYGKDKTARKNAFYGMYGAIKSLINTIASNYTGSVKQDNFFARARGFSSPLEQAMYMGDIPAEVYDNLIKHVGENLPVMHEYVEYRKKMLGGEVNMYDMHVSLVDEAELSLDFEDAFELVKKGLAPLGKDYVGLLERARKERWMDVYETENKRSGAYQSGCYGMHPFVLLNYSRTTHDIFTIAHELGHAMHSHFSDSALAYSKAGYAIFVAEVASTVNEVLLLKYLLSSTKDVALKKFLLNYYLDMFRTTLFRQTQFAEFEKKAHDMDLNGEALTADSLSDMYYELNKKYYGGAAVHNDEIRYEWARIPHFYNAFYVYKYATGITSAVNIADGILKNPENVVGYKKFLSAGGSDSPYEILKIAGVDLKTAKPYETAMKEFKDTLAALKKTLKRRFPQLKKTCKISIAALVCVFVMSLLTGCGGNVDVIQYSDGRNIVQLLTFSLPNTARVNIEANAAVRVGDEKWTVSDYMRALTGLMGFADGSRFEYETEGVDGGDWFTRYVRRAPITDDGGEEDEPDENYKLEVKNLFYVRRVTVTVSHPFNGYRSDWDNADANGGGLMAAIKYGIKGKDFFGRDVQLLPALTDAFPSVSGSDLGHLVLSFGIPAGAFGASSGEDREIDGVKFHCFERLFTTDDEVISYSYTVPYSVGWYVTAILLGGAVTAAIIFATRKKKPKERHPDIFPYDPFDEGTGGGNNLPSGYNSANNNG